MNPWQSTYGYAVMAPRPAPQQNLGLGTTWGVDPMEEWLRHQARMRAPGGDLGAFNAPETPLPVPPAWAPAPQPQGRPPAPSAPPAAPPVPAVPPLAISDLPAGIQQGGGVMGAGGMMAPGDDRGMWQQAGDWLGRQMTPNDAAYRQAVGQPAGGTGTAQAMQALAGMGARLTAPPQAPQAQMQHLQTPGSRGRGGPLPMRPGAMDRRRQGASQQRRRGILDE